MRVEPEQNASVSNRKADDASTNRRTWNYVHGIASFKGRARAVKTNFCGMHAPSCTSTLAMVGRRPLTGA